MAEEKPKAYFVHTFFGKDNFTQTNLHKGPVDAWNGACDGLGSGCEAMFKGSVESVSARIQGLRGLVQIHH